MALVLDRTFDWQSVHDPRSRNYSVRREITTPVSPRPRMWTPGDVLDQGREGACVGFGFAGEASASPVRVKNIDNAWAAALYHEARAFDRAQGWNFESGASVLAGAKALTARGLIDGYRWAFGIDDVRAAVIELGPVVIGIPWLDGMYDTRPSGLVDVSGRVVGGHCILVTGYHPRMRIKGEGWWRRHEVFKWRNSWGASYGKAGDGLITAEDLATLLADQGEACVPLGRKLLALAA